VHTIGCVSKHLGGASRQIRLLLTLRGDGEGNLLLKYLIPRCQEKSLSRILVPVPQTDTGR
jgi:hypothetical protein